MRFVHAQIAGCLLAAILAFSAGCDSAVQTGPTATTQPAPAVVGDENVMAVVDGEPIGMAMLVDLLIKNRGMLGAQQLIANKLVE